MKQLIPSGSPVIHRESIPIRWGDLDAFGHLNNCTYFKYMETVRLNWMQEVGLPTTRSRNGLVVASAVCNFRKQIHFPGNVALSIHASNIGRSSFDTWYRFTPESDDVTVLAEGGATLVWYDFEAARSDALPVWLRQLLGGCEASQPAA